MHLILRKLLLMILFLPTFIPVQSFHLPSSRKVAMKRQIHFRGGATTKFISQSSYVVNPRTILIKEGAPPRKLFGELKTSHSNPTRYPSGEDAVAEKQSNTMLKSTRRWLKWGSVFLLIIENSALTCTMRWTRACNSGPLYYTSTAVILSELLKIAISSVFIIVDNGGSLSKTKLMIKEEIILKPDEVVKLMLPGLLYTIQNNLQYVASSNLEPAVFQVMYQIKLLVTAVLSATMLKKKLKTRQWGGIALLMNGLVLVQSSQWGVSNVLTGQNTMLGYSSVLTACTLAGFAGCYLERILKGCTTSLWIRNIQLSLWGTLLGLVSMIVKDGANVYKNGFFYGYNKLVFGVIGIQAIGGLLISLVVRYGDALVKGIATGCAILLTTLISYWVFDFKITTQYAVGAGMTSCAVLIYSGFFSNYFFSSPTSNSVVERDISPVLSSPWSLIAGGNHSRCLPWGLGGVKSKLVSCFSH